MTPLEAHLAQLAVEGRTVTYGALALDLGIRIGDLTAALEAMMEQDARACRPQRAALCEGKLMQGLPAAGFFLRCAELGLDVADPVAFVAHHRARLFGRDE